METATNEHERRPPAAAVEVHGLTKSFGAVQALRGLDLTVPVGQVTGFLGPNGSGKSTTIRILLGLLRADGGRATVLGGDPWADAVRLHRSIAYVPGDVTLWPNLTGGEAIDILCRLSGPLDPKRKQVMLERFDLDPTKKARAYSKGNRQKVALVAALASKAELLLLDEPTSGLDPLMEAAFTESIREVKAEGRSVLLSSHIFAEVEKLADQVTIIREGVTVESGTIAQLRHLTRSQVTVVLDGGARRAGRDAGRARRCGSSTGTSRSPSTTSELPEVLAAVAALQPRSLVANPPSLEELFLRHYGTELAALNRTRAMTATTQPRPPERPRRSAARPAADTLAGTGTMIRLVVRRNRVRLVVWWVVLVGLFAYVDGVLRQTSSPPRQRSTTSRRSATFPSIKALTGLAAAPDTLGGAVWTKIWMTCALSLAFGVVFLVTRNGRADEEVGRTELLRSRILGLHAYSTASWLVNAALCVAVGAGRRAGVGGRRARPGRHRESPVRSSSARRWQVSGWSASASAPWRARWRPPRAGPTRSARSSWASATCCG